jgi:hypothetical protein
LVLFSFQLPKLFSKKKTWASPVILHFLKKKENLRCSKAFIIIWYQ